MARLESYFSNSSAFYSALNLLRQGQNISDLDLAVFTPNEKTYLNAEFHIRAATYSLIEANICDDTNEDVIVLVRTYRDLFINPVQALSGVETLLKLPFQSDLQLRFNQWQAHLYLLLGKIEGRSLFNRYVANNSIEYSFRHEGLAIRALGFYFLGQTQLAIEAHKECQAYLDASPDLFIQAFNGSMGCRSALKVGDGRSFEYFSAKLEETLRDKDDSRYRLRHLGYRAMIYNQLNEHDIAETYWERGDVQVKETESELEKGQYYTLRALSFSIQNDEMSASTIFALAETSFIEAGSPEHYLVDLDIAKHLGIISNPIRRAKNLNRAIQLIDSAKNHFSKMLRNKSDLTQLKYSEAIQFCDTILNGENNLASEDGRASLTLSLIENVSRVTNFAETVTHFRLIPNFVKKLNAHDLSTKGVGIVLEQVLKIQPVFENGTFRLPESFKSIQNEPEVKTILEVGSLLASHSSTYQELLTIQLKLKSEMNFRALAIQVSHDIRSPLSALEMISSVLSEVSEEKRQIVRNSVNRIKDIANALLAKNRVSTFLEKKSGDNLSLASDEDFTSALIAPLIETIITEKRIQFREFLNVDIEFLQSTKTYDIFSRIQASEFQRLISNLVNNAVEALENKSGKVRVELIGSGLDILVAVSDSGKGIDESVIKKLGQRGLTIDKDAGNGLGLYHAFQMAKRWNGSIQIESELQKGTTIKLKLPRAEAAPWFVPSLILPEVTEIVILDDDQSIHQLWKERLNNSEHACARQHLSTPRELREYFGKHFDSIEDCLFLVDYELIGHLETGLDLIEELGIEKQSILVTSHYEEAAIRERCMRRGIKLIPKPMSGFVPLTVRLPKMDLNTVSI